MAAAAALSDAVGYVLAVEQQFAAGLRAVRAVEIMHQRELAGLGADREHRARGDCVELCPADEPTPARHVGRMAGAAL